MPKERIDNVEFWYGTPDAPAPQGNITLEEPLLVVGASNEAAAKAVTVRYRGLGEAWQPLRLEGIESRDKGYFARFRFPRSDARSRIEYDVLAQLAGRSQPIGPTQTFRVTRSARTPERSVARRADRLSTTRPSPSVKTALSSEIAAAPVPPEPTATESMILRERVPEPPREPPSSPTPDLAPAPPAIERLAPSRAPLASRPVRAGAKSVVVAPDVIAKAWNNNAGVDLLRLDISKDSPDRATLNLSGLAPAERKAFIRDLQIRKRALRASGDAEVAETLLKKNMTSPGSTAPTRLASESGVTIARAKNIHARDIQHFGRLSHGLFTLIDAHSGGLQNTAVGNLRRQKVVEFVQRAEANDTFDGLDNIQELFGDLDSCNCKHCNSILGPSAYFVDLMHFIHRHVLDEDVAEGEAPFKGKQQHRLHLKSRRPDLWVLPLTCENTHEEIPQLQITNEILENFLAAKKGLAVTADRSGVVATVYGSVLPAGRHSIQQPFHLPIEELDVYLGHFKLRRGDIARLLGEPEDDRLRAVLRLAKTHASLITLADPSAANIQNKLGLTIPPSGILTIKELLKATALSRRDLGELIKSAFVGGAQRLTIVAEKKAAESVQFDIERVYGMTLDHLDRVHRLLRLQRHLPWLPRELDGFIAARGGALDGTALADAARAALLKERFKASVVELCALAGDVPDVPIEREKAPEEKEPTPFDVLFNVADLTRHDGRYPDPAITFAANETTAAQRERAMRLRAALRIDDGALQALVEGLAGALEQGPAANTAAAHTRFFALRLRMLPGPALPPSATAKTPPALPTTATGSASFPLSRRNLSVLLRHAVLARWLKLSVVDLFALIRLRSKPSTHVGDLNDATAVVEFYDWWKSTAFSLEDLSILVGPVDALDEQVTALGEALQLWLREQERTLMTDTFLTQISGVSEELSRTLVSDNIGKVFKAEGDRYRVIAASRDEDLVLSAAAGSDLDLDAVTAMVREYHPRERLPRAVTAALATEIGLSRAVVAAALAGSEGIQADDFLAEGALPEKLRPTLVAILRLQRIVSALKLAPATVAFFAAHAGDFGVTNWMELTPAAVGRFAAIQSLVKKSFRDDPTPALTQIERLLATQDLLRDVAVALFELDPAVTQDLIAKLRRPEHLIDALLKVKEYADVAEHLSVDATALANIVTEDYALASSASAAVIAGFRAKYPDESVWKEKVEPYQERVLEKKREALVDYLLRGPDAEFPDAREMYKYFLIDSEVDGCFRTSRVVAACSSLQLYVHRIRMNLEKEPGVGVHVAPSLIPDEEWEWRQQYRLFEANRKVFCWPENYLDPTNRDNKTPLFEDLESELLQQEITAQTVVDAYSNYLKALEELANLRYAGAYHHYMEDDDSGEVTDIIYLFGATGGDAPTHYWREIKNLARSQEDELVSPEHGPWRKVETRIPTRHVSPVVYDGQLHVFWNEITSTSQNAVDEGKSRFIGYSHRYALKFTSLRLDGQWTPPETISLKGAAPTFSETDSSIDDPLAEQKELTEFLQAMFGNFAPWFGIYRDPKLSLQEAQRNILVPRWGTDVHTKAREGYTLGGFMWERPYLSLDPSYGHRLGIHCAGLLVRGAVDLFDRQVLRTDDTTYKQSPSVEASILARRVRLLTGKFSRGAVTVGRGLPDYSLLRRSGGALFQSTWEACPFDYPVAASLALNADQLNVFERHWGDTPPWATTEHTVATMDADAGVWVVAGSPGETIIETEDELFLLQPSASAADHYLLHRLRTTLVRDVARKLFTEGVDGLLATEHQLGLSEPAASVSGPRTHDRTVRNPIANDSAFGIYYQELFLHIPLLIAYHLNAQNKGRLSQRWYHYVFDPTSPETPTTGDAPPTDRNWKYRQFRGQEQVKLRDVLSDTAAIQKYREDPFNAHAIARLRVSAYQKAVVMRYIDNLLDWADDRFTRFQMESVNEAMMLYVTAAEILGPRPLQLGECGEMGGSTRTYDKLKDSISKDGEFLLEVEELIPRPTPPVIVTAEPTAIRAKFGLRGLLAAKLSAVTESDADETPSMDLGRRATEVSVPSMAGKSVTGVAVASSAAVSVPAAPSRKSSAIVSTTRAGFGNAGEVFGFGRDADRARGLGLGAVMPPAEAGKASKGSTAIIASDAGKPKFTGVSDRASKGALASAATFTKIAVANARTDQLDKSFAIRQQFQFLGGRWKANGGRRIAPTLGDRFGRSVVRQVTAAFCVPRNEVLEEYWTRVEDRIQKIRTCRDITGRKRKLSLFAPPIDPALLVRARAAGIALDDVLGAFDGMIPQYRFAYLLQKAKEFAGTVQAFGGALQAALERKDAEELVRLQATEQQQILALTTKAKEWEMESAAANYDGTLRRKTQVENRRAHFARMLDAGLNEWEVAEAIGTHTASAILGSAATTNFISAVLGLVPQLGSPFAMKYGGVELKEGPGRIAVALGQLAELAKNVATSAALEGRNERRREDWQFQRDQAVDESSQIDKQIEAALIARDLAEHAVKLHEKTIQQNDELLDYHRDKFSALGFYTWLASQLQRVYRDAYNMAYRMGRYAEQAYRFEREDYVSDLLSGQYWDASRAGLLAGNRLLLDLQVLEQRYIETDIPRREFSDHVFSLRQWDPKALIELRQRGECRFKVPELFFDLASPGDYRRRLRSVRVTIPAVAGPYVNIMATLSLDSSQMRYQPSRDLEDAPRPRVDSITTSSARNDAGAFQLDFRAEKYVPFEGAAAVSTWTLTLPTAVRMFDYNTISDVMLHFDYTASFDALYRDVVQGVTTGIATSIDDRLASEGIVRAFNLKEEFPAVHARLAAGDTTPIEITADYLPFFLRLASVKDASLVFTTTPGETPAIGTVEIDGRSAGEPTQEDQLGGVSVAVSFTGDAPWKHTLRVQGVTEDVRTWLVMRFLKKA